MICGVWRCWGGGGCALGACPGVFRCAFVPGGGGVRGSWCCWRRVGSRIVHWFGRWAATRRGVSNCCAILDDSAPKSSGTGSIGQSDAAASAAPIARAGLGLWRRGFGILVAVRGRGCRVLRGGGGAGVAGVVPSVLAQGSSLRVCSWGGGVRGSWCCWRRVGSRIVHWFGGWAAARRGTSNCCAILDDLAPQSSGTGSIGQSDAARSVLNSSHASGPG